MTLVHTIKSFARGVIASEAKQSSARCADSGLPRPLKQVQGPRNDENGIVA